MICNPDDLIKLANYKMPFGRYAGYRLVDLPAAYVNWFNNKGYPDGELGQLLALLFEVKVNGLEYLFNPLKGSDEKIIANLEKL